MAIYRDETEKCPRCAADLIDTGAMRACEECRGLWVRIEAVYEMAEQMQSPPAPVSLELAADPRGPLPCPTCREAMETWMLHGVPVDLCTKHGVWFDKDELPAVLMASWMLTATKRP